MSKSLRPQVRSVHPSHSTNVHLNSTDEILEVKGQVALSIWIHVLGLRSELITYWWPKDKITVTPHHNVNVNVVILVYYCVVEVIQRLNQIIQTVLVGSEIKKECLQLIVEVLLFFFLFFLFTTAMVHQLHEGSVHLADRQNGSAAPHVPAKNTHQNCEGK